MRQVWPARYGYIDSVAKFEHGSTLVLSQISCIASGLALLEDEQKFKFGGCVGAHKTSILGVIVGRQPCIVVEEGCRRRWWRTTTRGGGPRRWSGWIASMIASISSLESCSGSS
jgi:hypothetical protein